MAIVRTSASLIMGRWRQMAACGSSSGNGYGFSRSAGGWCGTRVWRDIHCVAKRHQREDGNENENELELTNFEGRSASQGRVARGESVHVSGWVAGRSRTWDDVEYTIWDLERNHA